MNERAPAHNQTAEHQPWYSNGLRFQCTQCGNCCTGPPGYIFFNEQEGKAMANELGVTEHTFFSQYARPVKGGWSLQERKTIHGHDCIMLDRESTPGKAICSVYKSRPTQCRTWPFWPENLDTPRDWAVAKRATPCPGMDHGRLVPVDQIRIQRDATRHAHSK